MKSLSIGGGLALVLAGPVYSHAIKGFAVSLPAGKNDASGGAKEVIVNK